jgi:transcriptional regulator of met regulon
MPIFQWYISSTDEHYYKSEDIKKLKVLVKDFFNQKESSFTESFMFAFTAKKFKQPLIKDKKNIAKLFEDKEKINEILYQFHKLFASFPAPLSRPKL